MDFALDVGKAPLGALHPLFGAGASLARGRQRLQRNLGGAIGFRHQIFGRGKRVRGDAAGVFGRFDFADQRTAFLGEQRRRVFEFGALGLQLVDAGFDRVDLRCRALLAVQPFVAFGCDRLQTAVGEFSLSRQRLRFGAHLRGQTAMAVDVGSNRGQLRFGLKTRRQFGQRRRGCLVRPPGLDLVGGEAAVSLGQRGLACGVAIDLALGRGMTIARGVCLALGGTPAHRARQSRPRKRLSPRHSAASSACRLPTASMRACCSSFSMSTKARALGKTPRRAGRCVGRGDKAVPAPDVTFKRHQTLAGLELRNQLPRRARAATTPICASRRASSTGALTCDRQRLDALRQRGIIASDAGIGPAHRR